MRIYWHDENYKPLMILETGKLTSQVETLSGKTVMNLYLYNNSAGKELSIQVHVEFADGTNSTYILAYNEMD